MEHSLTFLTKIRIVTRTNENALACKSLKPAVVLKLAENRYRTES